MTSWAIVLSVAVFTRWLRLGSFQPIDSICAEAVIYFLSFASLLIRDYSKPDFADYETTMVLFIGRGPAAVKPA